jgi:L,D-peptidoglycan transpeptidase YkuD (ErfK/YbiS/YcfS/YnhG family)
MVLLSVPRSRIRAKTYSAGRAKPPSRPRTLMVRTLSAARTRGVVQAGAFSWPCAIGRSGIRAIKREGDGASPRGRWRLVEVFYRADRERRPATGLAVRPLTPSDGWCDAVGDRNYNRRVTHPYPASAEALWRADQLYDLVVVLSHNLQPRVQGAGSAIFMHVARAGFTPTAGCVALRVGDLRRLLACASRRHHLQF